jgi:hypothetical protein
MSRSHRAVRNLAIEVAFVLSSPGAQVTFSGSGETVVASSTNARAFRQLLLAGPGDRWRRRTAARLHSVLRDCGLTVDVRLGNRPIARLGIQARPTLAGRLAGMPTAQLGWRALGLYLQAVSLGWVRRHARS